MTTGESLTGSASVRKLQTVLHAKAKEEPERRFHALADKVWRKDFLLAAWGMVRRNGGAAGVDGVTVADIEAYGVDRWIGELSRELGEGTYEPSPVRQVLIPKKQPGKFRPLGIPCLRDRVAQMSAMLVLMPIFEADLEPEQYGYRPGRSARDAVRRVHRLLHQGRNEVVDADLSNYFGEIPHAELMKSIARRVSDGRMLGLVKAWLEMPVVEEDGEGGTRRTNRARKERKGTPQGAPISPLLSNIYMRRFILGWKAQGHARRFGAEIVNYADDFCVLGKAPAAVMLAVVNRLMDKLKSSVAFTAVLSPASMSPFPPPALRTGRADFPHPALRWDHAPRTRNAGSGSTLTVPMALRAPVSRSYTASPARCPSPSRRRACSRPGGTEPPFGPAPSLTHVMLRNSPPLHAGFVGKATPAGFRPSVIPPHLRPLSSAGIAPRLQ